MAELIALPPQTAQLISSGFVGQPEGTIEIIENGNYDVKSYARADVDIQPVLIEKTITENGTYSAQDDDADGYSQVDVDVPLPSGTIELTTQGEHNVYDYAVADVTLPMQSKSVVPTTQQQIVEPDNEYEGLQKVTVGAVTAQIDSDIQPQNIRKDVDILGVVGTMEAKPIEVVPKDVNFYGLYGELVYSYTADEFLALNELPALPEYDGFTAQNWNWDYEHLRQEVLTCGEWECGAIYIPSDYKTKIEIVFENDLFLNPELHIHTDTDAYIDWGDGSELDFVRGWGNMDVTHEYHPTSYPATYIISYWAINPEEYQVMHFRPFDQPYQSFITKLWLACDLVEFTFGDMVRLQNLSMPQETTLYRTGTMSVLPYLCFPSNLDTLGSYAGYRMSSIKKVLFSQSINTLSDFCICQMGAQESLYLANIPNIGDRPLYESYGFEKIVIDNTPLSVLNGFEKRLLKEIKLFNVSEIPDYALQGADFLTTIKIPNTVTRIGEYALNASNLVEIDMSDFTDSSLIPTLEATSSLNSNVARIYVANQEMLDAFSAATNWTVYTDRMVVKGA